MYEMENNTQTRWISFENPTGAKGAAAKLNKGAKGNAYEIFEPHESKTLCNFDGCGVINRIWMTLGASDPSLPAGVLLPSSNITPQILRGLRIEMFWDNASTPAVSVPLGDFFGTALSIRTPFESALFSDPEGKSYNCYIKMPFRKNAKIVVTNDNDFPKYITMYYEINVSLLESHNDDMLYFHTFWNRENPTQLGKDYTLLPEINGKGRYLGANIGAIIDPRYMGTWWGEGEVKLYMDGDTDLPTLSGTGAEDYPGSGYGLGEYNHQHQGCTHTSDKVAFYRYHIEDPVYFHSSLRITIQQIGSSIYSDFIKMMDSDVPIKIVSGVKARGNTVYRLLDEDDHLLYPYDVLEPNDYVLFYRSEDYSSTAYFYLDKPENGLPVLPDINNRTYGNSV